MKPFQIAIAITVILISCDRSKEASEEKSPKAISYEKADGYLGIWYKNQILDNEYKFKYSGGLGTYCAKHKPFAIYSKDADKTFFCYGGTVKNFHQDNYDSLANVNSLGMYHTDNGLLHMVSYYDHKTGKVPRPTILLDKKTFDAHDNPVISIDDDGYIWIFSTSHGTLRPSYIHRSSEPFNIDSFDKIQAKYMRNDSIVPFDNFSYMQPWYVPDVGFCTFMTSYASWAGRTIYFIKSKDGEMWGAPKKLASIGEGHYQISGTNDEVVGSAFNYHPPQEDKRAGLNFRTNLYFIKSNDHGQTWTTADGTQLELPLTKPQNPALVFDFEKVGLLVYLKDIVFDSDGNPIILFITSKGFESGPDNNPRTWQTARWNGQSWDINKVTTSDSNYDMGSIFLEEDGSWLIVAPTETGPQPFNPGGEMAMWLSSDQGKTWQRIKQLTSNSERNHTYARRPVNPHPNFYALWADGHGRMPSKSNIYFSNKNGEVFKLPEEMETDIVEPELIK